MDIISAEQAAEQAKGLTFEIVWAALMETRQRMEESHQRMQESQLHLEEHFKEQMKESQERNDKTFRESQERTDKILSELSKQLGGIGNNVGELTESMFGGRLWEKFAEFGIPVTEQSTRRRFANNKETIAEVDIFIENGQYAIPVEIKTKLKTEDIDEHIARIEKIRSYFDAKCDTRILLGAVAGGIVSDHVLNYSHSKGLFVIVQSGDSVTIADTPEGFKPREW